MKHEEILKPAPGSPDKSRALPRLCAGACSSGPFATAAGARSAGGRGASCLGTHGTYPGRQTRQFSLRPEQRAQVQQWVRNYQRLRKQLEVICELNHQLLRPAE